MFIHIHSYNFRFLCCFYCLFQRSWMELCRLSEEWYIPNMLFLLHISMTLTMIAQNIQNWNIHSFNQSTSFLLSRQLRRRNLAISRFELNYKIVQNFVPKHTAHLFLSNKQSIAEIFELLYVFLACATNIYRFLSFLRFFCFLMHTTVRISRYFLLFHIIEIP